MIFSAISKHVDAELIEECLNSSASHQADAYPIAQWQQKNGSVTILYQASQGVTWCQSYHFCRHNNLKLSIVTDLPMPMSVQDGILVWVAGRRKDFGAEWSWLNDNLTDFNLEPSSCKMPNETKIG